MSMQLRNFYLYQLYSITGGVTVPTGNVGANTCAQAIAISRLIMRRVIHFYRTPADGSRRHTGVDRCGVRRACALGIVRIAERIDEGNQ
jgi:hypothetical protein